MKRDDVMWILIGFALAMVGVGLVVAGNALAGLAFMVAAWMAL